MNGEKQIYKIGNFNKYKINCKECGKDIFIFKVFLKTKKFCSLTCRNKNYSKRKGNECGFFGKHHSETTKILMGNINKLQGKIPPSRQGETPWNKGKICPQYAGENNPAKRPEVRLKLSLAQRGTKANNWQGGKTKISKRLRAGLSFKMWREAVFKRDNFICQNCKGKSPYLHPHHIMSFAKFPALRFNVDNGITLCSTCHQSEHKNLILSN